MWRLYVVWRSDRILLTGVLMLLLLLLLLLLLV